MGPREAASGLREGEAVLGQARWGPVGHTVQQKIFKIKRVATCLRYQPCWGEGFGLSRWVMGRRMGRQS